MAQIRSFVGRAESAITAFGDLPSPKAILSRKALFMTWLKRTPFGTFQGGQAERSAFHQAVALRRPAEKLESGRAFVLAYCELRNTDIARRDPYRYVVRFQRYVPAGAHKRQK